MRKFLPDKASKFWKYSSIISRLALGIIFLIACSDKLIHPRWFVEILENYKLLPKGLLPFFAITLPWVELMVGILLLLGVFVEATAIISTGLLLVFFSAILITIIRGMVIECGCFGILEGEDALGWHTLFRDMFFLIFSIQLMFRYKPGFSLDKVLKKRS